MGLVLPPRRVSADASGNGRNGAKLRIYNANTTTLSSVFSDAALTVPLTNPVVADSSGVFPPIYAAEGALFDLTEQTSAGVTIRSEDDVPSVGYASGAFERDFTNSRVKISGVAGEVRIEGGSATGDDIGGVIRIGGWNNTRADVLELDAVSVNYTGGVTQNVNPVSALSIDWSEAEFHTKSISTNSTFTMTGFTSGKAQAVILNLTITSAAVPSWPAYVKFPGGANPSSSLGNGRHRLAFITDDGGGTVDMIVLGTAFA